MTDPRKTAWASAKFNEDCFVIETVSGLRALRKDPRGSQHVLDADSGDQALGAALRDALAKSRIIPPEEAKSFFHADTRKLDYADWVKSMVFRRGYDSKAALFERMRRCYAVARDGVLTIQPCRHYALEGWEAHSTPESDCVTIAADAEPMVVGAALRLAFSRCR